MDATEDPPVDALRGERSFGEGGGGGGSRKSGALVSGERYVTLGLRREDEDDSFGIGTMGVFVA